MELKKYRLGDIAEIIGGVSYSPKDICTGGIRILRGGNIQNQHIELKTDDVFLPISYKNNISQIYVGDTILVASTGSVDVLGKAATCFQYTEDVQIGAFLRIIRPKADKYTMLISSALSSDYFKRYIKAQAKGTSINNITLGYLRDFEIYAPHDFTGLSHLSANIENKICLNRAINDNLEAMAKQLYDYWFVQFDFPNEKGKPYKSSGGAMAYNERLKREIPVGWQCCCVNNLCEINKKAISKGEYHHIEYLDTGSITQGYINHTEYYRVDAAPSRAQRKVEDLTIIYSSVRPKLLHYGVLSMPKENFIVSTGFITLDAKNKIMALMVYYFLTSDIVTRYLASIADTAVSSYPSINPEDVAYLDVVLPNKDTIKKFNDIVEPMFRKMSKLRNEIAVLTKQRDELLPLLMNGQASVNSD